ncbi:hypothetical protein ACNKU7_05760 [Microbulbifer sp. SA54]|uniref:hypothetical protein n=1 Tax=Microbulbifer sp. SA54 TaxID=3401577 RepID=UPI003AAD6BC4
MKALKVKPEIVSLLRSGRFETFSVPRFRDAYQELVGDTSKPKKVVSQLVKRHLRKLEECGAVERINTGKPYPIEYCIKDRSRLESLTNTRTGTDGAPIAAAESLSAEVVRTLRQKLNKYRTDMLSATGALEEYEAIVQAEPILKSRIQGQYDKTREEYAKTLGKVRALESLIDLNPAP